MKQYARKLFYVLAAMMLFSMHYGCSSLTDAQKKDIAAIKDIRSRVDALQAENMPKMQNQIVKIEQNIDEINRREIEDTQKINRLEDNIAKIRVNLLQIERSLDRLERTPVPQPVRVFPDDMEIPQNIELRLTDVSNRLKELSDYIIVRDHFLRHTISDVDAIRTGSVDRIRDEDVLSKVPHEMVLVYYLNRLSGLFRDNNENGVYQATRIIGLLNLDGSVWKKYKDDIEKIYTPVRNHPANWQKTIPLYNRVVHKFK